MWSRDFNLKKSTIEKLIALLDVPTNRDYELADFFKEMKTTYRNMEFYSSLKVGDAILFTEDESQTIYQVIDLYYDSPYYGDWVVRLEPYAIFSISNLPSAEKV